MKALEPPQEFKAKASTSKASMPEREDLGCKAIACCPPLKPGWADSERQAFKFSGIFTIENSVVLPGRTYPYFK